MALRFPDALRRFESFLRVEKNLSPRTRNAYLYDLGKLEEFLKGSGIVDLRDVLPDHLKSYVHHLSEERGYGAATLARTISSMRVFFDFLVEEHLVEANPAIGLHTPKRPQKLPVYLIESELRRLFEAPDTATTLGLRDRTMLVLMAFCGMRLQELVGLNMNDLDFESQTIKVFGKGSKERLIPMNPDVEASLRAWLLLREPKPGEKAVFVNRFGHRLSGRMVEKIVDKYVLQAGISKENLSPHKLRHTFATLLHARDVDLVEIQALLGHAALSTTQIYTHTNAERLQEAVQRINDLAG